MEGLLWSLAQAQVTDVNSFQNKEGEVLAYVKLMFWGGTQTIMVDAQAEAEFRKYKDKMVACGGPLLVEIKKGSGDVKTRFGLTDIKEIKKS